MRHRHAALLAVAAVGAYGLGAVTTSSAGVRLGAATANAVMFPTGFGSDIYVGSKRVYTGSAPSTTTTVSGSTSTTPTTAPAPSTSSTTGVTSTVPVTSTTAPAATGFSEDFSDPTAFATRFDHGWSGELHAGSLFGADRSAMYNGDHDGMCGDPNNTHRMVMIGGGANETGEQNPAAAEQAFYTCLPGGDPAKGHVMTAVDTEGYVIAWFSPKGVFNNVHRVCWDQSEYQNGGGNWTQVVFLTPTEYADGDLGMTSPEFPRGGSSTPKGTAQFGVKDFGAITAWQNGQFTTGSVPAARTTNHAPRFQRCVTDNENGTLFVTAAQPDGTVASGTIQGQIPNGTIRVVFEHDTYNPEKHYSLDVEHGLATAPNDIFTWHFDTIRVDAGG